MKLVNNLFLYIIKKYKNDNFELDNQVSSQYLVKFLLINSIKYMRGAIKFISLKKKILLGKNTVILAKNSIKFNGSNAHIDRDCYIDALSKNGIQFGHNVSIQKRVIIECTGSLKNLGKGAIFGDNVGIGSNSFLGCAGGIEIGDDTIIGNYVSFHSENHNFHDINELIRLQGVNHKGIKIGKNCWIGAKVTILDGTDIGDGCIVAAGSVLTGKSYPHFSVIAGVPGKVIKSRL